METFNINTLNISESYAIEFALSHIVSCFNKHSRPVYDTSYRSLDSVVLTSEEVEALSKLHDIFYKKLYD